MSYSDNCRTLEFTDWPPFSTCHHLIANRPNKSRHSALPLALISGGARFAYGVEIFLASPEFAHCVYKDTGDEAVYWIPIYSVMRSTVQKCVDKSMSSAPIIIVLSMYARLYSGHTQFIQPVYFISKQAKRYDVLLVLSLYQRSR